MKKGIVLLATALALAMLIPATTFASTCTGVNSYAANSELSTPLGLGGDSPGDIALGSTNAGDKSFGMNKAEPTEGLVPLHIAKVTTENPASASREVICNDCHAVTALAARMYADSAYAHGQPTTNNGIALGGGSISTENDGQYEHSGHMAMHICIGGQNIPGREMT